MSWVVTGVVIAAAALGTSVRSGNIARKGQKHARERTAGRTRELETEASESTALATKKAKQDKAKRMAGYARNLNVFGSALSMSEQAASIRKNLTGQ